MKGQSVQDAYRGVWPPFQSFLPNKKFKKLHSAVEDAIRYEYEYLLERERAGLPFNSGHPKVRAASRYAHAAYDELLTLYPTENASNKQAFFDYLCALDFL